MKLKKVYDIFNQFELDDLKELNEYDRHIEHLELTDESIYKKGINNEDGIDDLIIRNSTYDELINAINKLSNTQRRRIKMYYFDELDLKTIASIEHSLLDIVKKLKIKVIIITKRDNLLTKDMIDKYNKQYNNLRVVFDNTIHDRYFILDNDTLYHCGASINRIGYKTFSINLISDEKVKCTLINYFKSII